MKFLHNLAILLPLTMIMVHSHHPHSRVAHDHCEPITEDDDADYSRIRQGDHVNATHPLQVPDVLHKPLTPEELKKRNATMRHLSLFASIFTDSFHHWLLNPGEPCDPDLHSKWMNKSYQDFYHDDEWQRKVCTFTRFLHCSPATKVCECAPKEVYGIELQPAYSHLAHYSKKTPCLAALGEPCFFFMKPGAWPGLNFRMSVKLNCPQAVNGSKYSCGFQTHKNSSIIVKRCQKCRLPGSHTHTHSKSSQAPRRNAAIGLLIYLFHSIIN